MRVANLLELPPLKSSYSPMIMMGFCLYLYLIQGLWWIKICEWSDMKLCLYRSTDEAFREIPPGPKIDSPWSQLYQHLLGITMFPHHSPSLHDIPRSLVAPQDSSVLHLLIQARSNTSYSLMMLGLVAVLRIPGHQISPSVYHWKSLTTCSRRSAVILLTALSRRHHKLLQSSCGDARWEHGNFPGCVLASRKV